LLENPGIAASRVGDPGIIKISLSRIDDKPSKFADETGRASSGSE
jgi:hypothetical protein